MKRNTFVSACSLAGYVLRDADNPSWIELVDSEENVLGSFTSRTMSDADAQIVLEIINRARDLSFFRGMEAMKLRAQALISRLQ